MKRREKWFWILVGVALLIGFFALIPFNGEICEKADNSGHKECASHGLPVYAALKVQAFLDFLGVAITALATIAIAWFTLTLRRSTDRLWDAGERQLKLAAEISAAQSRDMKASIAVARDAAGAAQKSADALISAERAHLLVSVEENNILDIVGFHGQFNDANREDDLETPGVGYFFKNFGKTHATVKEVRVQLVLAPKLVLDIPPIPYIIREPFVGPQARTEKFGCLMFDTMTVGKALAFKRGESAFWLDGYIVFDDAFGVSRRYQYTLRYRTGENGFRLVRQSEDIEEPDDDIDDEIPF
jgi:hypothetical protein